MHLLSRFRRAAVVALVSAALIAPATRAQQAFLSFRGDPGGSGCAFDLPAPYGPLVDAYLFVDNSLGFTQVTFGIPQSISTPAGDLVFLGFDSPHVTHVLPDGAIRVTAPSCLTGTGVYVGHAQFLFVTGPPNGSAVCQPLQPIDLPGTPMQFRDCSGVMRRAGATPAAWWSCCDWWTPVILCPWDPNPPDGATGVSLTPVLTWKHEGDDGPNPSWGMEVRFSGGGIDTTWMYQGLVSQFVPPPLEPATTYTWSVNQWLNGYFDGSSGGHSEWTFTTAPNVPVRTEPTTWGRVKALYRAR